MDIHMTSSHITDSEAAGSPSLLIADDYALVRRAVRTVALSVLPQSQVQEVGDVVSLLRAASACCAYQLAVVSAALPGMNTHVLNELADACPSLPIIVVSSSSSSSSKGNLLRVCTVKAVLDKGADLLELRVAMKSAVNCVAAKRSRRLDVRQQHSIHTERQREVYRLMREGLSNKLIGQTLNISTGTVKNHLSDIFKILKASNRTHAARLDHEA